MPKPLLPVGGKPILDRILDSVIAAGADRIILSTNKKFQDQFSYWAMNKTAVGLKGKRRIEIVVEPTMHHGEKFGAIKGINYTIRSAKIDNDVMIVAGDNFFTFGLRKAVTHFNATDNATIAVHDVKSFNDAKRFGVVSMNGFSVTGFEEKPEKPKSSLISTGIYIFPKRMLRRFGEYIADGNNPDAPGYFLQWLVGKEDVHGVVYHGRWYDIGTIDTYRKVFDGFIK